MLGLTKARDAFSETQQHLPCPPMTHASWEMFDVISNFVRLGILKVFD